ATNVGLKHEIAERERAENALRESEARYRLITENSVDLIAVISLEDARWAYASPSFQRVLGREPAALIGTLGSNITHPDDVDSAAEQFRRAAHSESTRASYRFRHADGSWRWIEAEMTAIVQQNHRYAVVTGRDITERKILEAQLFQSQKLESVGRLAGGIAHDFNNLLTAILGNLELALKQIPANGMLYEDITEAFGAAERASGLTRQLLAFARKQMFEPRVINLNTLIANIERLLRRLIGEHIDFITRPAPDLGNVRADPGQLEQLLINLTINASDAMPHGGKLTIETHNVTLDDAYAREHLDVESGDYVMLAVSDTGIGMDEATLHRLFEPFFTTKEAGRGTGLGLATCYGIVKQHGGQIWPYSEQGCGSTFRVYLPRIIAPSTSEEHHVVPTEELPRGSETVLLAEDEPLVRELAARVLNAQGYRVIEAINSDDALRQAHSHTGAPIELLVTDMVMPGLPADVFVEAFLALYPQARILFISGYAKAAVAHRGQIDPNFEFLHKPFSIATLARKVRQVLDKS
ncbi:MAG TPA: ATP-binding protein, partial [Roseiflexaceae bacterium]|nr:ATP-binding protein [Roseiflexaceae bacterium]